MEKEQEEIPQEMAPSRAAPGPPSARLRSSLGSSAAPQMAAAEQGTEELVEVADGFTLHMSSKSATGYQGVSHSKGRFSATYRNDGFSFSLGTFDTAVKAAVAVARQRASLIDGTSNVNADGNVAAARGTRQGRLQSPRWQVRARPGRSR